jgi:hypothetical protein
MASIPAQKGGEARQVCVVNRMRLGKLIQIISGPNWEKPEEAGGWGGGQELKDTCRLEREVDWGGVTVVLRV